jgi:4-diphosphocytidyl-2-C-methyl-D-erythritol kinase
MLAQLPDDIRPADMAGLFELAPAKINLALHVVGRRPDGYHLLESIVTFADIGDSLYFKPADTDRFSLSGRFADTLAAEASNNPDNLVLRARDGLRRLLTNKGLAAPPVAIHLEKNLPIAAGLGGGSADAAATLRGLLRLWQVSVPEMELAHLALSLGADVPMCLRHEPLMVRGVGEDAASLPGFPSLALVLGNPMVGVGTPEVFRRLERKENPPISARGEAGWIDFLQTLRNDLEPPARAMAIEIGELAALIQQEGALLTRMTGSGATCFGIFSSTEAARRAADTLRSKRPDWYFKAVTTVGYKGEASA